MDLADLDLSAAADRGADMQLEHPVTGELLFNGDEPMTIRLLGRDSREFRAAVSALAKKSGKQSLEAAEAGAIELLVRLTTGWSNIVFGGELLEFSPAAAAKLYRERAWIREQVDRFVGERGNFYKAGVTG